MVGVDDFAFWGLFCFFFPGSNLLLVSGNVYLDGGFKYFLFSSLFGEDFHFD